MSDNMNKQKELISYKNSIIVERQTQEAIKKRCNATLARIRSAKITEATQLLANKTQVKLDEVNEKIQSLSDRIHKLDKGDLTEFINFCDETVQRTKESRKTERKLNDQKAIKQKNDKEHKDKTYKKLKAERRSHNWDKKKYGIYYRKFCKSVDSLPEYMKENLKSMPNNKGYIWRSVQYYGEQKPIRGEPVILFEKRSGVLWIRKYYNDRTEIYKKATRESGTELVETIPMKKPMVFENLPGAKEIEYADPPRRNNNRRNNNRRNNNRRNNNRKDNEHKNSRNNRRKHNRKNNDNKDKKHSTKKRNLNSWN